MRGSGSAGIFIDFYNFSRTHTGIEGMVPADRFFQRHAGDVGEPACAGRRQCAGLGAQRRSEESTVSRGERRRHASDAAWRGRPGHPLQRWPACGGGLRAATARDHARADVRRPRRPWQCRCPRPWRPPGEECDRDGREPETPPLPGASALDDMSPPGSERSWTGGAP